MALLVKKFGGTSVGDIKKIKNIASSICQSKEAGNEIVVVVSAMGKTTDNLNCLAESISKNPNRRELDMLLSTGEQVTTALLSMALNEYGIPAISIPAGQDNKGHPLGLQLISKALDEQKILNIAFAMEKSIAFKQSFNRWWE